MESDVRGWAYGNKSSNKLFGIRKPFSCDWINGEYHNNPPIFYFDNNT